MWKRHIDIFLTNPFVLHELKNNFHYFHQQTTITALSSLTESFLRTMPGGKSPFLWKNFCHSSRAYATSTLFIRRRFSPIYRVIYLYRPKCVSGKSVNGAWQSAHRAWLNDRQTWTGNGSSWASACFVSRSNNTPQSNKRRWEKQATVWQFGIFKNYPCMAVSDSSPVFCPIPTRAPSVLVFWHVWKLVSCFAASDKMQIIDQQILYIGSFAFRVYLLRWFISIAFGNKRAATVNDYWHLQVENVILWCDLILL
jgi:hypothetical protein